MPTVVRTLKEVLERGGEVDGERLARTTDKDIDRMIAEDPDFAPVAEDLAGWRRVHNPPLPDVRAIRERLGLSQAAFARRFGFSVRTVQQWEQGRAVPDRPARILLRVIERAPDTVAEVVATSLVESK